MKKAFLFLLIAFATTAHSQSLNDLLFSGKLKSDSGSVVRKTDDLKSKIDTTTRKKPVEPVKKVTPTTTNSSITNTNQSSNSTVILPNDSLTNTIPVAQQNTVPAKSNNKIWKEYSDALAGNIKDVLSSKKVKKDSYYFLVEYEIGTDGVTTVTNVTVSPENAFLLEQVKQRIVEGPPQLNPVFDPNNKPQKVKRRYNFYVTKE